MTTLEILDRLQGDALKDGELRRKLLATRLEKDPLTVFCRLCRELGYELYEMDLVSAGEDFYATIVKKCFGAFFGKTTASPHRAPTLVPPI